MIMMICPDRLLILFKNHHPHHRRSFPSIEPRCSVFFWVTWIDRNHHRPVSIGGEPLSCLFPYSSNDGFSVKDFLRIDEGLGDWQDVASGNRVETDPSVLNPYQFFWIDTSSSA